MAFWHRSDRRPHNSQSVLEPINILFDRFQRLFGRTTMNTLLKGRKQAWAQGVRLLAAATMLVTLTHAASAHDDGYGWYQPREHDWHSSGHDDWHSGPHVGQHRGLHFDPYYGWHYGEHYGPHAGRHHDRHDGPHHDWYGGDSDD